MSEEPRIDDETLPGLYRSADQASIESQSLYFNALRAYLALLIIAAFCSFAWSNETFGAIGSALLFLITLGILVFLRVKRPDDLWYNGRAVAESVKTRSWRYCMRAEPYEDCSDINIKSKQFIKDLKTILKQNRSLSEALNSEIGIKDPISPSMTRIRALDVPDRLKIYNEQRIDNQAKWYAKKSIFNKNRARLWFWVSVVLHAIAIGLLLYRIKCPNQNLPIEVIATGAGAVLTWLQAKKHNELHSSYSLTAHEIVLIKAESSSVNTDKDLAEFVLDSETAFSREHTQWAARRVE